MEKNIFSKVCDIPFNKQSKRMINPIKEQRTKRDVWLYKRDGQWCGTLHVLALRISIRFKLPNKGSQYN